MSIALGTLAVVLAGLGGPNPPRSEGPEISYQFKMIELRGLEWRTACGQGLKPVASRDGVAVWTAPRDFLKSLPAGTVTEPLTAPRLVAYENAVAHITSRRSQPFVTQAAWRGDQDSARETTEMVREGMAATIRGRRIDQGVLAYLVIENTEVRAVHTVELPARKLAQQSPVASKVAGACDMACAAAGHVKACDQAVTQAAFDPVPDQACCATQVAKAAGCGAAKSAECAMSHRTEALNGSGGQAHATTGQSVQLRVPEIGRGEIAGEWLIPRDEVLLVGFGPHTVADKDGKAVIREQLALITAEEVVPRAAHGELEVPTPPHAMPRLARPAEATASASPSTALPMPAVPSRSLPQGVNADGTAADLPPLPDEVKPETSSSESSDPRPSPQAKRPQPEASPTGKAPAKPAAVKDAKATKAAFGFPGGLFRPAGLPTIGLPNLQFMLPLKPFELKLPLNQKLQLELIGRVVPDTDPTPETGSDGE
jgi:hypothetical protein